MKFKFSSHKKQDSRFKGILGPILTFMLVFALFYYGISSLGSSADHQEQFGAEQAIRRSAVHCYATQGFYPPSITYLEEHYGLQLNREKYTFVYEVIGDNIMPIIRVVPIGADPE